MEFKDLVFTYWIITLSVMVLYAISSFLFTMYNSNKVILQTNIDLNQSTTEVVNKKKISDFEDIDDIDNTIANYRK